MIIQRECKHHGLTRFSSSPSKPLGRCLSCRQEDTNKLRHKNKKFLIEKHGGKCKTCSYNKCQSALVFHHLDPSKKDFEVGQMSSSYTLKRLIEETDKCILICHNCHTEVHAGLRKLNDVT